MIQKIILSGFGGQGVLSAGLMLAEAAMLGGLSSTYFPAYGAEMRGGTANCSVVISDNAIASPIVTEIDILIALNKPALEKFSPRVKDGGVIIYNSSLIKEKYESPNVKAIAVPAEDLALEKFNNPKIANVIILGAFIKQTGTIKMEKLKESIKEKFNKKGEKIIQLNYLALELGYNYI